MRQSLELLLDARAFVVLYEEDLSSYLLGFVKVDKGIIEKIKSSWLAIVVYRDRTSGRCIELVVSRGDVIDAREVDPFYVYPSIDSILRKDVTRTEKVCEG